MSNPFSNVSPGTGKHPLAERSPEPGRYIDSNTTGPEQLAPGPSARPAPAAWPAVAGHRRPGRIIKSSSLPRPTGQPGIRSAATTSQPVSRRRPSSSSSSSISGNSSNRRTMSYNNGYMPPGRHARQTSGGAQNPNAMNAFSTGPVMIDPSQQFNAALYPPYGSSSYPMPDMPTSNVMGSPGFPDIPGENDLQKAKRKEQNRNAQKAFRVRNNQKIKDLETKLDNVSGELQQTKSENAHLRTEKEQLEYEIQRLKDENYRMQASQNSPGQWGPY